ncbi:hypothetical protein C8Q78DRAFT_1050664 [Trametes maxima]|nr:hypothetical protein C8Q78DRAFT_1050664 [Trametes maxima]
MDPSLSETPLAGYTTTPQTSQLLDELLSRTIGVFILGTFASLILYGICIIQFYGYVRMYRVDATSIKLLVYAVMILETVHTAFSIHACYFYLVSNYSDAIAATHGVWSIEFIPTLQAIITLVSQAFFARRVSLIGPRHQALAIFAFVLLVGSLVLAIFMTVDAVHAQSWYFFFDKTQWITSCGLLLAGVADFALSSAIIVGIRRSRAALPRPGSTRLDVVKLYVVNTGILTG